jgi:anti-sigma factor RsiW
MSDAADRLAQAIRDVINEAVRAAAVRQERPTPTPAPLRSGLIGICANAAVALCVNALGVGSLARSGIHCKSEVVEVVGELVGVDVHGRDGR